jgi:hypothetical protein
MTLAAAAFASVAPGKMLPAGSDVKGWKTVAGARTETKGNDISRIYDGGYEFYLKNGVVEAARDVYMKGGDVMEVTVHKMKSEKAARSFFEHWKKELKPKSVENRKGCSLFTSPKPQAGWLVSGTYLVSAIPSKSGDAPAKDARMFLLAVQQKISAKRK